MASSNAIRPAPGTLKAAVWQHFGFYEVEGKLDKTYTVCKVCGTKIKYFGVTLVPGSYQTFGNSVFGMIISVNLIGE